MSIDEVRKLARRMEWHELPTTDEWLISFEKASKRGPMRINVWRNSRSSLFTVGTYLNHPKQGKTQLFRKHCGVNDVEKILKNPREHTGKGYR